MSRLHPTIDYRPIPGWPNYFAGDDGSILSLKGDKPRVLTQHLNKQNGYLQVSLTMNGRSPTLNVHKLVMSSFGPAKPSPKHEIRHRDGKKSNNRADNLIWGTHKENMADAIAHGTMPQKEKHWAAKLTQLQVNEIRSTKGPHSLMAKKFGIHIITVSMIRANKRWKIKEYPGTTRKEMN